MTTSSDHQRKKITREDNSEYQLLCFREDSDLCVEKCDTCIRKKPSGNP